MKTRKPTLFIGSSLEARDFAEGIQLNLQDEFRVLPWTQLDFKLSRTTLDSLDTQLDESDFAAFIFAPDDHARIRGEDLKATRDNVLLELGMFMGRLGRDRSFIVLATGTEEELRIPTDLLGITAATFDHDAFDPKAGTAKEVMGPASATLRAAMRQLPSRPRDPEKPQPRIKNVFTRGSTDNINNVADCIIYVADNRHKLPEELKKDLFSGKVLPTKYLYFTPYASSHWLDICRRDAYAFYRSSLDLIRKESDSIAAEIRAALKTSEVDFVSIGSGDGEKDNILLQSLAKSVSDGQSIYYYPLDISLELLNEAIPQALGKGLPLHKFRASGIVSDFTHLPELKVFYEYRPYNNVFSVLGNTIGNADEFMLMRKLADAMLKGDLVLLEFNTLEANADDPLLRERVNLEHDFAPLASLNVELEPAKMRYQELGEQSDEKSVVPKTRSILATYDDVTIDGRVVKDVKLSIIHHYDFASFEKTIANKLNVETVAKYEENGVGLLLAQRRG